MRRWRKNWKYDGIRGRMMAGGQRVIGFDALRCFLTRYEQLE